MHPARYEGELSLPGIIESSVGKSSRLLPQRVARLALDKATKQSLQAARESYLFFVRHAQPTHETSKESALSWQGKSQARMLGKVVLNSLGPNPNLGVKFYHESSAVAAQTALLAQEFLQSCGVEALSPAPLSDEAVKELGKSTRMIAEYAYGDDLTYAHNATVFVLGQAGVMQSAARLSVKDVPLGFASGFRYQAIGEYGAALPIGAHTQ